MTTMPKTASVQPPPVSVEQQDAAEITSELIGWAADARLGGEQPLTPGATRQVLAAALGVDEEMLSGFTLPAMKTALKRLRLIMAQFERLEEEAAHDDLTGALRRRSGIVALQREIDRARRLGSRGVVVAFLDVDGLKRLNDTRGHAAGDEVLRHVVGAMRERVRSYDLVFRYGGDEFILALVDVSMEQAQRTVNDIRRSIRLRTGGEEVSVGLAEYRNGDNATRLLARADAELYAARSRRRGEVTAATG
jgi:diguanylate cyclase (GGDEF)-like protein